MRIDIAVGDVFAVVFGNIAEGDTGESPSGADCSRMALGNIADATVIPTGDNPDGFGARFWHQVGNEFAQIVIHPLVSGNRELKAFAWQFVGWIDIDPVSRFADNEIFQSGHLDVITIPELPNERNHKHHYED